MSEYIVLLSKLAGHLSLVWLIGGVVFLWLSGPADDPVIREWRRRTTGWFAPAAAVLPLALLLGLLAQAALVSQLSIAELVTTTQQLERFSFGTWVGRLSLFRIALTIPLLCAAIILGRARGNAAQKTSGAFVLVLAALVSALGPMGGHTAGSEDASWLTPQHIAHVLLISVWLGGLPAWIGLVITTGSAPDIGRCAYASAALLRFSRLAMACMLAIIASGAVLAFDFVDSQGSLLGTAYGLLICGKLLLLLGVLAIANHARASLLPGMKNLADAGNFYPRAARWVGFELLLAAVMLGLGGVLSQTTPAVHDQPYWWLPFRFSIDATWPVEPAPLIVSIGAAVALLCALALAFYHRRLAMPANAMISAAGVACVAMALWYLSVPAFPGTYWRSQVPYLTVSIAKGMSQFGPNCASCHGAGGLGDGVEAKILPRPPADLSAPHTALHTGGDMFWWLTHGIPQSGMPGLADALSEQDRWDMINFLRAFSQGFEARILTPKIAPLQPWLGAPNFYYESSAGLPRALKDFRGLANVLLVFATADDGQSIGRLERLRDTKGLEIVLISRDEFPGLAAGITQIRAAAEEIHQTYELLSRTISNRGDTKRIGMDRKHMEFLIDRFGYIRARWIAGEDAVGWRDTELLRAQALQLSAEPQILPPPDDHIH